MEILSVSFDKTRIPSSCICLNTSTCFHHLKFDKTLGKKQVKSTQGCSMLFDEILEEQPSKNICYGATDLIFQTPSAQNMLGSVLI